MKRGAKITLGIVGVLAVAGAAVAAWQWNNLSALRYGLTLDQDNLDQRLEENQAALNQAMDEYQIEEYSFSAEEMAQLADGTMTAQEAAQKLLDPETVQQPDAAPETPAESVSPEQEIKELVATMYVLQATYLGKLDAVVQSAIDEYLAGEQTSENRTRVVYSKIGELTAMEKTCDSEVAEVVSRLRELLKATGQEDTLASQIESAYQDEKSLKKAYYLNAFRKGGGD